MLLHDRLKILIGCKLYKYFLLLLGCCFKVLHMQSCYSVCIKSVCVLNRVWNYCLGNHTNQWHSSSLKTPNMPRIHLWIHPCFHQNLCHIQDDILIGNVFFDLTACIKPPQTYSFHFHSWQLYYQSKRYSHCYKSPLFGPIWEHILLWLILCISDYGSIICSYNWLWLLDINHR